MAAAAWTRGRRAAIQERAARKGQRYEHEASCANSERVDLPMGAT